MPFDPAALGDQMIVAGKKQADTGDMLKEASLELLAFKHTLNSGEQIDTTLISLRGGATAIRDLLTLVVNALQSTKNAFNSVSVPTVTPLFSSIDFPVIGRVRFVIGISVGSTFPLAVPAAYLEIIRLNIAKIRDAMKTIADDLRDLRGELPNIRKHLKDAATNMDSGGSDMIESGKALQTAGRQLGGS